MRFPTEIALKGLNIRPSGQAVEAAAGHVCSMCARPLNAHTPVVPFQMGKSFTDFPKLVDSKWVCGFCDAATEQKVMRKLQSHCITEHGVYPLSKDSARAWFWLTPPEPPYIVVINHNTTATFHYVWRTPVTLDNRLVSMNVDNVLYRVRRHLVQAALKSAEAIMQEIELHKTAEDAEVKTIFQVLLRSVSDNAVAGHGRIRPELYKWAAKSESIKKHLAVIEQCGQGELLALSPFLKSKPALPECPALITSIDSLAD